MTDARRVDASRQLADAPLADQVVGLEQVVRSNPVALAILERSVGLDLPGWYLGAGAITQTVWNQLHGFEPAQGIKDYDLVYFDLSDLSAETERQAEQRARALFRNLDVEVDVTNEARVHLWYPQRFGRSIPAYTSSEDAIRTWPTTASSIGVRLEEQKFVVCAPFGLRDLFAMIVRPNKAIIDRSIFEAKAERWASLWPSLTIVQW
jgi:uncharacterized protein